MKNYTVSSKNPEESEELLIHDHSMPSTYLIPAVDASYTSRLIQANINQQFQVSLPLFTTFELKKISWAEKEYSFNLMGALTLRLSVDNMFTMLEEVLGGEILNEEDIIKELTVYDVRTSYENSAEKVEGETESLYFYSNVGEYTRNRVVSEPSSQIDYRDLRKYKAQIAKKEINYERERGYVTSLHYAFNEVPVDLNEDMRRYPYNFSDLKVSLNFENKKIMVKSKDQNGETEENYVDFAYSLKDSTIPSNVFKVNFDCDQLESWDPWNNYAGYRYFIKDNKIQYYITLRHDPDFAYQFTILPMQMLQLFQIFICLYGDTEAKLNNIISMYIAFGAFAIIVSGDHVQTKDKSICDKSYYIAVMVSLLQFLNIILMAFTQQDDKCNTIVDAFTKPNCALDGTVISLASLSFLYSMSQYVYIYSDYLWKKYVADLKHLKLLEKKVETEDEYWDLTTVFTQIGDFFLNLRFATHGSIINHVFKGYKDIYGRKSAAFYNNLLILDEWRNSNPNVKEIKYKTIWEQGYDYNLFLEKFDTHTSK